MATTTKKSKAKKRCPSCGYKIRGPNHEEGRHHQQGRNGQTSTAKGW